MLEINKTDFSEKMKSNIDRTTFSKIKSLGQRHGENGGKDS